MARPGPLDAAPEARYDSLDMRAVRVIAASYYYRPAGGTVSYR